MKTTLRRNLAAYALRTARKIEVLPLRRDIAKSNALYLKENRLAQDTTLSTKSGQNIWNMQEVTRRIWNLI